MEKSVGLKKVERDVDVEIVLVIVMMATRRDRHQLWASFHIRRAFTFPSLPHHHFPPLPYQGNPGSIIFRRAAVISLFYQERNSGIFKTKSLHSILQCCISKSRQSQNALFYYVLQLERNSPFFTRRSLKDLHVTHKMFSFGNLMLLTGSRLLKLLVTTKCVSNRIFVYLLLFNFLLLQKTIPTSSWESYNDKKPMKSRF